MSAPRSIGRGENNWGLFFTGVALVFAGFLITQAVEDSQDWAGLNVILLGVVPTAVGGYRIWRAGESQAACLALALTWIWYASSILVGIMLSAQDDSGSIGELSAHPQAAAFMGSWYVICLASWFAVIPHQKD